MHDHLKKILTYDPKTGTIYVYDIIKRCTVPLYARKDLNGYLIFNFKSKTYLYHRVAWFLYYGTWPTILDHVNGLKNDNRISNLREVTRAQNSRNRYPYNQSVGPLIRAIGTLT